MTDPPRRPRLLLVLGFAALLPAAAFLGIQACWWLAPPAVFDALLGGLERVPDPLVPLAVLGGPALAAAAGVLVATRGRPRRGAVALVVCALALLGAIGALRAAQ